MSGGNSEFPIGEKERENLEKMARDIFVEEMAKIKSFEFVDADTNNAADVLYVRAGLLDVVSRVPPEPMGRTDVYLDSVGQATLVIELVDAESDTVLARAIDVRAAGSNTAGPPIRSNSVVNSSEVKRLLRTWSETLRSAIEYLAQDVGAIPTSP